MNFPKTNNFPKTHFFKTLCLLGFLFIGGFISVWSQQGIGTNQPNPSSALEISSQDKGVLIPRMTTTMRDAIVNPALGLMVFNTTTLCLEINTSSNTLIPVWECMGTGQRIITSLACYAATVSGSIFTGKAANAEISIPYGGGNASSYAGGTTISSGQALGATGLTATLQAGNLNTGTGLLTYTVSGTMSTSGNAYFDISFGGQHCVLVVPVNDSSSGGTAVVSSWNCAGTATGTLYNGQIPNGVTKTVYANVTKAGSYNIKAVSNGVTYSASGNFAGAGNNIEVVLVATGIPVAAGTTSFTLDTDPNCSFDSVILDASSGGTATVSNWDCNGTSTGSLTLGLAVSGVTQEITANVSTTGTYDLTATANGITFTASGTFAGTGLQTITLTATGTPTAIGTHSYTLSTTPGCSFDRTTTLDPSSGGSAAVEAWDCSGTATGSSTIGVSSAGHTKTITASVTTAGSYNVSASANGVTYSAAGTFATTGTNTITLTATGTPTAGGTATFTLSTTPGCSFNTFTTDPSSGGSAMVSSWNCSGTSTGTPTVGLPASGITQEITATVSTTGTYDLSATANGITFTATGTFAGTGLQTITLTATGTPTAIGTHSYTLSTTPGCSFDRTTVADPSSGGSAVVDAWDCTGAATGSSTVGISSAGNTKTITASVTTAGSYSVSAAANGVTYSAVGTFAGTGSQTITLTATGTPTAGGTATYTLSTTPNCSFNIETTDLSSGGSASVLNWDCSGTSTGTPTVGIAASGITQEITANVSTTGSYDLTATANGITFTASGTFAGTGLQTITLTATGTPTAIGTHSYTLSTTPDCSFDRTTVADPTSGGTAVVDAWDCTGTATGSSTVGISSAGNTKTITASVTTVGSYSVSATANGVTYSAAGTFAGIGAQSVVLTATGTPTAGGTATYTLSTTPNCSFNIETTDLSSGGSAAVTAWDCSGTSTGTPTLDIAVSGVSQQVTANVSTTGSYDLSATANGITFTASGTFAGTGSQTITLTATGTPTATGTHSFALSTTPGCSFDFETILPLAVDCSTAATSGTLYKDFVVGGTTGDFSYSIEIENITTEAVTATFATTDLTPSGITGSLGVVSVNPAGAVSIAANSTQTVVYTFGGTPTASGTLNLDWASNNLSCATSTATVLLGTASFTLPVVFEINAGTVSRVDNTANQVVVNVPYTNAIGAYADFTGTGVLADTTSDTHNMNITYTGGSFDVSGSGSIAVTIQVDGDGSYVVALPTTSTATIVTLPFFYNGNTSAEGDIILNATKGLPAGMAITNADQNKQVISIFDTDYDTPPSPIPPATLLPIAGDGTADPTVSLQGVIGTSGSGDEITVTLTTSSTGGVAYPAFTQTISIPSSLIEGGGGPIDLTMTYDAGTTVAGAGTITATIAAASTLNVKQLDLYGGGLSAATPGYPLAAFSLSTDDSGGAGTVGVRIVTGIPDRAFGDGDHDFLYTTVENPVTGKTWLSNNLGATYTKVGDPNFDIQKQANAFDDHLAYGSLYQWGRSTDGHELVTWSSATAATFVNGETNTRADVPANSLYIYDDVGFSGQWRVNVDDDLWLNESAVNNPCPVGFRLPTNAEFEAETDTWSSNGRLGAHGSPLKWTTPGRRQAASLSYPGNYAFYWSGERNPSSTGYYDLHFYSSNHSHNNYNAFFGHSVRCIKD